MEAIVASIPESSDMIEKNETDGSNTAACLVLFVRVGVEHKVFMLNVMPGEHEMSQKDRTISERHLFIEEDGVRRRQFFDCFAERKD